MKTIVTLLIYVYAVVEACFVSPGSAYGLGNAVHPSSPENTQRVVSTTFFSSLQLGNKTVQDLGHLYLLTDPSDPIFYQAYEKLSAGGFGRLLRYRGVGANDRWVDLEFVYQDELRQVTMLDYGSGRFFRITLHEAQAESSCLFPLNDDKGFNKDGCPATNFSPKLALAKRVLPHWAFAELQFHHVAQAGLSEEEIWSSHLLRGPPAEDNKS